MSNTGSNVQLPGNNMVFGGSNEAISNPDYGTNSSNASVSSDHPIAAPSSFKYLDDQLNKMDQEVAESGETGDNSGGANEPAGAIAKATTKIMKHIVIPGAASVGTISIGYMLLFGRTVYSAIAMLMGLGLGSQRLDPATLLDYWEREASKRSDSDKKVEGMFR